MNILQEGLLSIFVANSTRPLIVWNGGENIGFANANKQRTRVEMGTFFSPALESARQEIRSICIHHRELCILNSMVGTAGGASA